MAKRFTVEAVFKAKDQASATIGKVDSRFKRLTKTIKSSALAQVAALGGVVVALRSLTRFISSSIAKANEQEIAVNQLNAALSSLGASAAGVSKRLQEQASALQSMTTFGDEAIIGVQTMIASFVKNEEQIKAATAATLDFSVAFGIDLKGAAALVSKTLGSTTNALTRYGIEVEGAVGSTERLTSLVENIATVAGGRAAAEVNTFAGAWKQLSDVLGDVQEQIAGVGTKNNTVIESLHTITRIIKNSSKAWKEYGENIKLALSLTPIGLWLQGVGLIAGAATSLSQSFNEIEISESALEATAKRHGITVAELNERLRENANEVGTVNTELGKLTQAQKGAAAAAVKLAGEEKRLSEELAKTESAFLALGQALGKVTSLELELELEELKKDFDEVAKSTVGASAEFASYAEAFEEKSEKIRTRIESIKSGMGDLAETTKEKAVPAVKELADEFERGAVAAENEGVAMRNLKAETDALTQSTERLVNGRRALFFQLPSGEFIRTGGRIANVGGSPGGSGLSPFGTGGTFTRPPSIHVDSNGNVLG